MLALRERLAGVRDAAGSIMSASLAEWVRLTALSAALLAADGENLPLRHPMPDTTAGCSRRGRGAAGCSPLPAACLLCADAGDGDLALPLPSSLGFLCSGARLLALPFSCASTTALCSTSCSPPAFAFAFSAAADATDALSEASSSSCSCLLFTFSCSGAGGLGRGTGVSDSTSLTSSSTTTGGRAFSFSGGIGAATLPPAPARAAFLLTQLPMAGAPANHRHRQCARIRTYCLCNLLQINGMEWME